MDASVELQEFLEDGEQIEAIVFGPWGWDGMLSRVEERPVPADRQGVVMSFDEAVPLMADWSFDGGFGMPDCHAVYVWTNQRVIWVTQYDGSTCLSAVPRNPMVCIPDMPGG